MNKKKLEHIPKAQILAQWVNLTKNWDFICRGLKITQYIRSFSMTFKNDRVASGYGASQKFDVSAKNGPIKAFLLAAGIIRVIFPTIYSKLE